MEKVNNNGWHDFIDLSLTPKENFRIIEEKIPGSTNYEAVKKYLQRLRKKVS